VSKAMSVCGCPPLNAQNSYRITDGVAHQTSLRSQGTMMTRADSREREAGRLFILPVTARDHISTQASPHTDNHRAAAGEGARRQNSS
jgi:hypothetical protein